MGGGGSLTPMPAISGFGVIRLLFERDTQSQEEGILELFKEKSPVPFP